MILCKTICCQSSKNEWGKLSQQNRVIKIGTDAGFLTEPVTCREFSLPRDDKSTDPKDWIQGNTKLDPFWKSQPVTYKVNMEWKSELNM